MPETLNIDNDIIGTKTPKAIYNHYKLGLLNGVLLDVEEHPWYVRKIARYNFDYLKANQEDRPVYYL